MSAVGSQRHAGWGCSQQSRYTPAANND